MLITKLTYGYYMEIGQVISKIRKLSLNDRHSMA